MKSKIAIFTLLIAAAAVSASAQTYMPAPFRSVVEERLKKHRQQLSAVCPIATDPVARRVFAEYGAMFVAADYVRPPSNCVFTDQSGVSAFQTSVRSESNTIGGTTVELQAAAMKALLSAIDEAKAKGLSITPRGGNTASKRSYENTVRIWNSRFEPALKHWTAKGKISAAEADEARNASTNRQVQMVMAWEDKGFYFNTNFSRTIFSSVAAPGTSQHLAMLALDVQQFADKRVRDILNRHGWYQTIANDTPHFTFIGRPENELPLVGLRPFRQGGFLFWVPNIDL